jgi:hypothetical protein
MGWVFLPCSPWKKEHTSCALRIDDSRVVTDEHPLDERRGEYARHCDYLAGGKVVLMQPPERYINHSCDPNTFVRTVDGGRYVLARRDIHSDFFHLPHALQVEYLPLLDVWFVKKNKTLVEKVRTRCKQKRWK